MPEANHPELEAILRAEVDRAVAPYEGIVSPIVLRKLRELAERYYREQPQAARVLQLLAHRRHQVRSGEVAIGPQDDEAQAAGRKA